MTDDPTIRASTKVLIVDDRPENLMSLEALLAPLNLTIVKAQSGKETLRLLLDLEVAVIILDVSMPVMDGFETAKLIRQRDRSRHVPIIFLTAYDPEPEKVIRGYQLGAVDFIHKPIEVEEIIRSKVSVFVELHEAKERALELERQRRQVRELEETLAQYQSMAKPASLTVGSAMYGAQPLSKSTKQAFAQFVERYADVLALSLESRAVKIEHDIPAELRALAGDLGFLRAGPRDVVELHAAALASKTRNAPAPKAQAMVEESRFRVLELMGNLVSFYRNFYIGNQSAHDGATSKKTAAGKTAAPRRD